MSTEKRLAVIYGTRPELIKLVPVIKEMRLRNWTVFIYSTAQQANLLQATEESLKIRPDRVRADEAPLNPGYGRALSRFIDFLSDCVQEDDIQAVIVQGDTLSALSGALVGFLTSTPVFHVEAGLRSGSLDAPFPEEAVRQLISRIATLHFAPTELSRDNLVHEGIDSTRIKVVGNTVIDTAKMSLEKLALDGLEMHLVSGLAPVLFTLHRREVHGRIAQEIWQLMFELVTENSDLHFELLVHSNPAVIPKRIEQLTEMTNVKVHTGGMPYLDFIQLVSRSGLIFSDSGGLQEEAAFFGVPLAVMRDRTERPEALGDGSWLVGSEPAELGKSLRALLDQYRKGEISRAKSSVFGDGSAGLKIADDIEAWIEGK